MAQIGGTAQVEVSRNAISVEVSETEFNNLALKYLNHILETPQPALVLGGFLCIGLRCGFLCASLLVAGEFADTLRVAKA